MGIYTTRCQITNTESTYHNVWLHAEVYARQMNWQWVYRVDSKVLESLPVGTHQYSLRDLEPLRNQDYLEPYKTFFLRAGTIPADSYRYSITLMPMGGGNTVYFTVAPLSPPRLLRPFPHDSITDPRPLFSWTPPMPPQPRIKYEFRLVELLSGQSAEEGIGANSPFYLNRNLATTSLKYPTSAPTLPRNRRFAWQVTAFTPDGAAVQSEVSSFHFSPARLNWWQCDRDKGHFWQGTEHQRTCPEKSCGGRGEPFEPPVPCGLYWNSDSLVLELHIRQEMNLKSIRIIVAWVSKNGRQAADAELTRTFDPPQTRQFCDTVTVRAVWPSDFKPTGIINPPAKNELNLDRLRVTVLVNGHRIISNRKVQPDPP